MPSAELVGRDDVLALASRRWEEARAGRGHTLLVAGEAGIGKSRMLAEITALAEGAPVVRAAAYPRDAESSGALLRDVLAGLRRAGLAVADRLAAVIEVDVDAPDLGATAAHARRRLVGEATEALLSAAAERSILFAFDDLHWADDVSLEVLQRVATGMPTTPSLVLAGYRSDELVVGTPAAQWRTRLLQTRSAEEVRLPRLDLSATSALAAQLSGHVPSTEGAEALHRRSNGIPLHIEELVAAGSGAAVPETVAQAVLLRAADLDPHAVAVSEAAAVIGRPIGEQLLAVVSKQDPDAVDDALLRLIDGHFLVADRSSDTVDFRHALIRDVIYERTPPGRRRSLHARIARAGAQAGLTDAELSDHFERAGLPGEAHAHAVVAALSAQRADAHREAAALYARALRCAPADLPRAELARLHARNGLERQIIDDNAGASTELELAIRLLRQGGDLAGAAALVPNLMSVRHRLGAPLEQRLALASDAMSMLDESSDPDPAETRARASLHGALATAFMLDRRLEPAIAEAELGLAGDHSMLDEIHIDSTLGSVLVFAGRADQGWSLLERAIELGTGLGADADAATARAHQMLASTASVVVEYDRARHAITDGMAMAAAAEVWGDHHYLRAHRAHVRWATGDPDAAADAAQALADATSRITEITALHVLGYAALGRGEFAEARRHLERALDLATGMKELQRLSPALWGLAESALLEGDLDRAIELTDTAAALSAEVEDAAYLFPHLVTGARARIESGSRDLAEAWITTTGAALRHRGIPGTLPAIDHADGLLALADRRTGEARELLERARSGWDERRRVWEGTWARLDLARVAQRARRPGEQARLLNEARERAAAARMPVFAARAASLSAGGPAGRTELGPLSAREFEVAQLVAEGATNREIAERLFMSPKTASAHIEHILAKLKVARRSEIAAWVARGG